MRRIVKTFLVTGLVLITAAASHAQLVNGDFETGDFTGWSFFLTSHGGIGNARVTPFDTAGSGSNSFSAQFEVGQASGTIGGGSPREGGGIYQFVALGNGQLTISAAVASQSSGVNADGGLFYLLLDGTIVASHDFGSISVEIKRATLTYAGPVLAGSHEIEFEMLRGYGIGNGDTPYQYVDDVLLAGSAVPEPSTVLLSTFGLATLAVIRRRKC